MLAYYLVLRRGSARTSIQIIVMIVHAAWDFLQLATRLEAPQASTTRLDPWLSASAPRQLHCFFSTVPVVWRVARACISNESACRPGESSRVPLTFFHCRSGPFSSTPPESTPSSQPVHACSSSQSSAPLHLITLLPDILAGTPRQHLSPFPPLHTLFLSLHHPPPHHNTLSPLRPEPQQCSDSVHSALALPYHRMSKDDY
jgi:hypothetical protein